MNRVESRNGQRHNYSMANAHIEQENKYRDRASSIKAIAAGAGF